MKVNEKIRKLREQMERIGVQAYIIPSSDAHLSEYVAAHWQGRSYLSGFTGSAGTLVVTMTESGLWTDGRYFIQAESELATSEIQLFKMAQPGVPTITEYLAANLKSDETVGFDGKVISAATVLQMLKTFKPKGINVYEKSDLLDYIWLDRPAIPSTDVFIHETKYTGYTCEKKLQLIRHEMKHSRLNGYLLTSLGSIAWLFNIRGNDILFNPLVVSYALVLEEVAYLFVDEHRLSLEVKQYLINNGVTLKQYAQIDEILQSSVVSGRILSPLDSVNYALYHLLDKRQDIEVVDGLDLVNNLKAVKNEVEIQNTSRAQVKDSCALVRAMQEIYEKLEAKEVVTEFDVCDILERYRRQQPLNYGSSFGAIVAYGANAAMMHYNPTPKNCAIIENKGFLLIDSGGQYLYGTTDITRTFVLGTLTEEEKIHYTLVLKGHINLSQAIFQKGCTGGNLDILARQPLWSHGLDYRCGTGHGVAYFGGVHEGPQGFRLTQTVPLKPGMIITNEPGVYEEGRHGIRIENTLLVKEKFKTEYGEFYEFETISYFPIDTKAIVIEMLSDEELTWLNQYHQKVVEILSPHLTGKALDWLKREAVQLKRL